MAACKNNNAKKIFGSVFKVQAENINKDTVDTVVSLLKNSEILDKKAATMRTFKLLAGDLSNSDVKNLLGDMEAETPTSEARMSALAELGIDSYEDLLSLVTDENVMAVENDKVVIKKTHGTISAASSVDTESLSRMAPEKQVIVNIDGKDLGMKAKKIEREANMEGIKASTQEFWGIFLDTYFSGALSEGEVFRNRIEASIRGALVRFDNDIGFTGDVNLKIQEIKKRAEIFLKNNPLTVEYLTPTTSETQKNAYMASILVADFDFTVGIISGLIAPVLDEESIKVQNYEITGLSYQDDKGISTKRYIRKTISDNPDINNKILAEIGLFNDGTLDIDDSAVDGINIEVGTSSRVGSFHMDDDAKMFYTTKDGIEYEVSPETYYGLNLAAKINQDSMDPVINALDHDTQFIKNIFKAFKVVDINGKHLRNMDYYDFQRLASHLVGYGANKKTLIKRLHQVVADKGPVAKIAKGILAYVYEGDSSKGINPLAKAKGLINRDIVQTLTEALTSKMQVRYARIDEGITKVSSEAKNRDFGFMIEDELSRSLLDGIYTKAEIANGINVLKSEDLAKMDKVYIDIVGHDIELSQVNTITQAAALARAFNLGTFFNRLRESLASEKTAEVADKRAIEIMKDIGYVAAANIAGDVAYDSKITREYENRLFGKESPVIILDKYKTDLLSVLGTDVTEGETIAGSRMPANKPMDRNASIGLQIESMNLHNSKYNNVKLKSNPFMDEKVGGLSGAAYKGYAIKSPTQKDGDPIKLSSWSTGVRTRFSIVQGMFKMMKPSEIGKRMFFQPVAYSDKSMIPMHEVELDFNAFDRSGDTHKRVFNDWAVYNAQKNIDLQLIMIDKVHRFLGGNFTKLSEELATTINGQAKIEALTSLITKMKNVLTVSPDMDMIRTIEGSDKNGAANLTKDLNMLMAKVGLTMDMMKYNDSDMDADVDYVKIGNDVVMKPHMGELANQFVVNPNELSKKLVSNMHKEFKLMDLDTSKMYSEIQKQHKLHKKNNINAIPLVSKADMLERIFWLNGTYGHAIKMITMGDESYFDKFYSEAGIEAYYKEAEEDPDKALEDTYELMVKQSKRAQSNLTNGHVYAAVDTVQGLKRNSAQDNLVNYVDAYDVLDGPTNSVYEIRGLEGKGLIELEALGILERFEDGSLISKDGTVRVNIGSKTFDYSTTNPGSVIDSDMNASLLKDALSKLITEAIAVTDVNTLANVQSLNNVITRTHAKRKGNKLWLDVESIVIRMSELRNNGTADITVADFTPQLLLDDPVSIVDLLNAMGVDQESSDAVQLMHPLYELMFKSARGNNFSGFHNDASVALKTLTTTFEYGSFRQQLQKKSVQNPFNNEQMAKLGSPELFALLTRMNKAIRFNTTNMILPKVGESGHVIKTSNGSIVYDTEPTSIQNMDELFNYFKGYERSDSSAWADVMEVMSRYGENMHNFVGLVHLPSGQKTGRRKMNRWDDMFSNKDVKNNIDYMANEFNIEVLTKAHDYDTSDNAAHASKLTLLSQLVNAVGFGGLTNTETQTLQNALESLADVENIALGSILADSFLSLGVDASPADIGVVEASLRDGDIIGEKLTPDQKVLLDKAVQSGMYDMVVEAFSADTDSALINKILKDVNASVDTPLVRQKILNQMRSGFYKDVIQAKMAGFIGTVSTVHNMINIYSLEGSGRRVGRAGFISANLKKDLPRLTSADVVATANSLTPLDDIIVNGEKVKAATLMYGSTSLTEGMVKAVTAGHVVQAVRLPTYNPKISVDSFKELRDSSKVSVSISGLKGVFPKWFVLEEIAAINAKGEVEVDIDSLIVAGKIQKYVKDEFNLKWYRLEHGEEVIEETDAYKASYRNTISEHRNKYAKKTSKMYDDAKRKKAYLAAALVNETRRIDADGKKYWAMTAPEVVLPTFNAAAFGLKVGFQLHEIVGTNGNDLDNAITYFAKQKDTRFKLEKGDVTNFNKDKYIDKYYKKKMAKMRYADGIELGMLDKIIELLEQDGEVYAADINEIITQYKKTAARIKGTNFLKSLEVTMTRIPGQTKQSGFAGVVVEFLDAQGNATFAPTEHLVQTGGDFDIDTLSVLTKSIAANGMIYSFEDFKNTAGVLDSKAVLNSFKDKLADIVTVAEETKDAYNDRLSKRLIKLTTEYRRLTAELKDDAISGRIVIPQEIARREARIQEVVSEILSLKGKEMTADTVKDIVKTARKLLRREYVNMLSNAMESGVRASLFSVDTAVEQQTPVSFDIFGSIIQAIDEVEEGALGKYKDSKFNVNGLSFISHMVLENSAAQGKEAIGIFATVLKMTAAIQSSYYAYMDDMHKVVNPYVFKFEAEYTSKFRGNKKIKRTRTGYADIEGFRIAEQIAKDPNLQRLVDMAYKSGEISSDADRDALIGLITDEVIETMYVLKTGESVDNNIYGPETDGKGEKIEGISTKKEVVRMDKARASMKSEVDGLANYKARLKASEKKIDALLNPEDPNMPSVKNALERFVTALDAIESATIGVTKAEKALDEAVKEDAEAGETNVKLLEKELVSAKKGLEKAVISLEKADDSVDKVEAAYQKRLEKAKSSGKELTGAKARSITDQIEALEKEHVKKVSINSKTIESAEKLSRKEARLKKEEKNSQTSTSEMLQLMADKIESLVGIDLVEEVSNKGVFPTSGRMLAEDFEPCK